MSKASERLQELQIEINAKIAEAQSIAMGIVEEIRITVGAETVVFDGYNWTFPDGDYGWYSSSADC